MTTAEIKDNVIGVLSENPTHFLPKMLINIQFLRFIAAMLVVFYHISSRIKETGIEQGVFFDITESVGFAGVDIFFVISGFIMAYTTTDASGFESGVDFAKRRFARIYSGYWPFYLLAIALFAWMGGTYLADSALWRSLILWPTRSPLISVSWTLFYEMFFYLLFTLLIIFQTSHRKLLLITMTMGIVAWSLYSQFVRHAFDPDNLYYLSLPEVYMFSPYLVEFLGGSLLAGWLKNKQTGRSWSWLLAGIFLFLMGGWINNVWFDGRIEQGYYIFWRVLIFGLASLFIVLGLVRLEFRNITTTLRFSLAAGGASYAIYLSHVLWLYAFHHIGLNSFISQFSSWVVQLAFLFCAAFILFSSMTHYQFIERPLHRLFKKWLRI
jgi:exopolysaccharide production protein ExoZ